MEIKTSELTGKALDYAVAVCESIYIEILQTKRIVFDVISYPLLANQYGFIKDGQQEYSPSINLSQGWTIAERERIQVSPHGNEACATYIGSNAYYYGETYLQAAMICYVASKLGDVVEIPDELVSN